MSTAVVPANIQLPAYLAAKAGNLQDNDALIGGIKDMSFPRISIDGAKFHIVKGDEFMTIMDDRGLPEPRLSVVIVGGNPGVSKVFYKGKRIEGQETAPDCSSEDGLTPDPNITQPQSPACAVCPQNVWGSKVSEATGKDIKACGDHKMIVVLATSDLEGEAYQFRVPASSLKDFAAYVKGLTKAGVKAHMVETYITFDPAASYARPQFAFARMLTEEEFAVADERVTGDEEIKRIASPRKFGMAPIAQVAAPAPVIAAPAPAPAAPKAKGFNTGPTAPAAAPATPAAAPAAPAASGKPARRGKTAEAPATPVVAAAAAGAHTPDPYAGMPGYVKQSVEAAGGLASAAGAQVFAALVAQLPKPQVPTVSAPVVAPPAPAPAASPVPTGQAGSLEDILAGAMSI